MKISYQRTGGFAGLVVATSVDLKDLPAAEASALQKLVRDADFFNLPESAPAPAVPDSFQHSITVESDGQRHTVQRGDQAIPDGLRPLLDDLAARARSSRKP